MENEVLEELKAIIDELTIYAHFRLRSYYQVPETAHKEPDDIVQESIRDFLSGDRNWNKDKYPTLSRFLKSVIDSKISNWHKSKDFETVKNRTSTDDLESDLDPKREEYIQSLHDEFYRIVGDDEALFTVLAGRLDGLKRREIAESGDLTAKEVTNATKRLERKIQSEFNWNILKEI